MCALCFRSDKTSAQVIKVPLQIKSDDFDNCYILLLLQMWLDCENTDTIPSHHNSHCKLIGHMVSRRISVNTSACSLSNTWRWWWWATFSQEEKKKKEVWVQKVLSNHFKLSHMQFFSTLQPKYPEISVTRTSTEQLPCSSVTAWDRILPTAVFPFYTAARLVVHTWLLSALLALCRSPCLLSQSASLFLSCFCASFSSPEVSHSIVTPELHSLVSLTQLPVSILSLLNSKRLLV